MYYRSIPFVKGGKVLDIGCGNSSYLAWLKKLGWEVFGVEIDKSCVEYAQKEYGIDLFCGDLLEAGFPERHFCPGRGTGNVPFLLAVNSACSQR